MVERIKQITREQADQKFLDSEILHSDIEQDKKELRLFFRLNDHTTILVKYDVLKKCKSYYSKSTYPIQH